MTSSQATDLEGGCQPLRSLHRAGDPLLLPNAWDVASARAVVAAGFPVVATTSWGVAATLGHEDHADAPADDMLGAAARIARDVDVPVTADVEAGYDLEPAELVAALRSAGVAGCNLEDTDHATGRLGDPDEQAQWLRRVREAASGQGYGLVVNARVDVFFEPWLAGDGPARGRSFPRRCGARTCTSRPASTACTRSSCGRGRRWRASCRTSAVR